MSVLGVLATRPVLAHDGHGEMDWIEQVFEQLTSSERRNLQAQLFVAGLYRARIDGRYGLSTRRAILLALYRIRETSQGRISVDLTATNELEEFMRNLAKGAYSRWLTR